MAVIQERKSADGKVKYRVLIRMKGYPPQSATFERKSDAKKWAQDTESNIRNDRHFITAEAKKHTLAELIDRYIEFVLPTKPKVYRDQLQQLTWWKAQLGPYLLSHVTPAKIAECRDRLLNEVTRRGTRRSPSTVVRYIAPLSHTFTMAVKDWGWMEYNPVSRLTRPTEPRGRVRYLDEEERERLLAACRESESPLLYPVVVLALSTGMRQGEILRLQWKDVDFERRRVLLLETKNGERRAAPLVGRAYNLLRELVNVRRLDNPYVFPAKRPDAPANIRKFWEAAVKKAGIEDFRFHDLRHTAASYLAMNGVTLAEIAEVLGHKTLQMVKRYAHLSETHTAAVVERMNAKIFG